MTHVVKNPKLGNDVVFYPHNNYMDVFYGDEGWDTAARFLIKKINNKTTMRQLSGDRLPRAVFQQLLEKVQ